MALLLGRLAGAAAHHWKRSALVLVAVLAVLGVLASTGTGFSDDFSTPGTESQRAYDLLSDRFPAQAGDTAAAAHVSHETWQTLRPLLDSLPLDDNDNDNDDD